MGFAPHAIPPKRAGGGGTLANLCAVSAAAVKTLEPNGFASGNSFHILLLFIMTANDGRW